MLKTLKKHLSQALSPIFPSLKSKPKKTAKKGGKKGGPKKPSVAQPSNTQSAVVKSGDIPEQKVTKKVDNERRYQHLPSSFPFHPIDSPLAWRGVEDRVDDAAPRLEIVGCSLGRLHATHARKETLEGVLRLFERISWPNSVPSLAYDHSRPFASSTDMLAFDVSVCFELVDIWFADHETLRLRMLPRHRKETAFQIVRFYQRDPACENAARQLAEQPVSSEMVTFVDVKLANPYLPLLMSIGELGGDIIELAILPFPSLCRSGPHYGELLASGQEGSSFGVLQHISKKLLQSALHRQSDASVAELKIDLRRAVGTERIFAPDLLYWLTDVLGIKLTASHLPSTENQSVRSYLLASLGIEPGNPTGVPGHSGKALRLPSDAIPSVQALMSDWMPDGITTESGFILASIHDNMPKWLFKPPAQLCGASHFAGSAALFPVFEPLDRSTPATEKQAKTEISAIRFCRFGLVDEVSLVYPTMPTKAITSIGSIMPQVDAFSATTLLLSASGSADMAIACLEAVALQSGAQSLNVLVAGRQADEQFIEGHLKRLFQEAGRFVVADEDESDSAVLNRLAGMADSELLVILTAPVLLHDRRSIAQLTSLMMSAEVASASCALIGLRDPNGKSAKPAPVFTGWFGEIGADGKISSIASNVEEILSQLPSAVWPVASNSNRLLIVRTAEWCSFGGFDEAGSSISTKFWANMIAMGRFHLLTTTFTAGLQSGEGGLADTFSGEIACFPDLHHVEKMSVQIRRLVA